jgi:NADH-quinone oxidoreductase subunit J
MTTTQQLLTASAVLLAAGLWLFLPRGMARGRAGGMLLTIVGLGLWAAHLPSLGTWLANGVFGVLAAVTLLSAVGTITFRNPVYCAIWFGMTLTGTAGLFLYTGAEFLAVATLVVYAGAILVTFLFVLMLAQPQGRSSCDWRSWEPLLSAAAGAVLVGVLSMTLSAVLSAPSGLGMPTGATPSELQAGVLTSQHVARFGTELFTKHLLAVEVTGTLLFAALVGAAVIVAQGQRRGTRN